MELHRALALGAAGAPIPADLGTAGALGLVALVLTPVLARGARALGVGDASGGAAADRKPQRQRVPTVGGIVLLVTLILGALWLGSARILDPTGWLGLEGATPFELALVWGALLGAFALGLLDDSVRDGLAPFPKVLAQALAALPLAFYGARRQGPDLAQWSQWMGLDGVWGPWIAGFLTLLAALAAMNIANTFDNHDGALAGVAAVGCAWSAAPVAAGLLGFLPWNTNAHRRGERDAGASPTAYLGDSGSHLIGLLVLLNPAAWPVLLVPSLDLARLSIVRWRAGSAPWVGDRRHLAHLLVARGRSRLGVTALLGAATLPAALGVAVGRGDGAIWGWDSPWTWIGYALSLALAGLVLGGASR